VNTLKLVRSSRPFWAPGDEFLYTAEKFTQHENLLSHLLGPDRCGSPQYGFVGSKLKQVTFLAKLHGWRVEIRDMRENELT
jgi:hypothetical protein